MNFKNSVKLTNLRSRKKVRLNNMSTQVKYGDKRDYPKIDIYLNGKYVCSTTWSKTLKDAVRVYADKNKLSTKAIKAEKAGQ